MATNKKKLLITQSMAPAGWALLKERGDIETVEFPNTISAPDFQALLGKQAPVNGVALGGTSFGPKELAASREMLVVARIGVGYDAVDVPALTAKKIPLMVAGSANSPSVAEQAMYMMLMLAKRGAELNALVTDNQWNKRMSTIPVDLFGKTVLVVGFGRIGTRSAKRCQAMEMNVLIYDPYVPAATIKAAGCEPVAALDAALPRADFVTIHCPKTPDTVGMFNAARIARMKPTAYLVNTARGGIIDESALHSALIRGVIRAAGLDVFDREPPSPDNPLLKLDSVLTAPHMAGVTKESFDRMAVAVANNLLSVLDGKPNVDNMVNKEVLGHR
jgi:D-3-phosphoglycerate dehydrogenase